MVKDIVEQAEKEFNFIGEIRNNPRIVNESDLQKMEYIELSYTGELIPVEEVEGKFDEFIKISEEDMKKKLWNNQHDNKCIYWKDVKNIIKKRAGEELSK